MNQKTLFRVILAFSILFLGVVACRMDITSIQNPIWLVWLAAAVIRILIKETRKLSPGIWLDDCAIQSS